MSQPVTAHKSKLCLCHQLRNDASLLWSVWRGSDLGRPARTGPVVRFRARLCARIVIETSRSANWSAVVRSGPRGTGPSLLGSLWSAAVCGLLDLVRDARARSAADHELPKMADLARIYV